MGKGQCLLTVVESGKWGMRNKEWVLDEVEIYVALMSLYGQVAGFGKMVSDRLTRDRGEWKGLILLNGKG